MLLKNNIIHHKTGVITFVAMVCLKNFSNQANVLCRLLTAKSRSAKGASHLPAYMGSCLTICQMYLPCPPGG